MTHHRAIHLLRSLCLLSLLLASTSLVAPALADDLAPQDRVTVIVTIDTSAVAEPALPPLEDQAAQDGQTNQSAQANQVAVAQDAQRRDRRSDAVHREIDKRESEIRAAIPNVDVLHRYDAVVGGMAIEVPRDQVALLQTLPGVTSVIEDQLLHLDSYSSPKFIGAQTVWRQLGGQGHAGEGVIVGVIDSGVWPEHPSFSDPDPSGSPYASPPPPADDPTRVRACQFGSAVPGDGAFACNNKLIGAYRFMASYDAANGGAPRPDEFPSARDDEGHGTNTASIAVGNSGVAASIGGQSFGVIGGVAPRSHLIVYKSCGINGCFASDTIAAIQQAVRDGVDVINFSISGGLNPYSDPLSLAFREAYAAGITVVTSGGDTGPSLDTVQHREPWTITVGASSTDRKPQTKLYLRDETGDTLKGVIGVSATGGISTTRVIDAAALGDPVCSGQELDAAYAGAIVLCNDGDVTRLEKSANVQRRGGLGVILIASGDPLLFANSHTIPTILLSATTGEQIRSMLSRYRGVTATWKNTSSSWTKRDIVAPFSGRGGPGQTLGISKPDLVAPGVTILGGYSPLVADRFGHDGEQFAFMSGTSAATPHVAGSAALLKQLYPAWGPASIKSALMTTARGSGIADSNEGSRANAFSMGSGRVDLRRAAYPGVIIAPSLASLDSRAERLWHANLPSFYHPALQQEFRFNRTARNVSDADLRYRFSLSLPSGQPRDFRISLPDSISIESGRSATFSITIDPDDTPVGATRFATLIMIERNGGTVRIPITFVRG